MTIRGQTVSPDTVSSLPAGRHFVFDHVIRRGGRGEPRGGIRNSTGNIAHVTCARRALVASGVELV